MSPSPGLTVPSRPVSGGQEGAHQGTIGPARDGHISAHAYPSGPDRDRWIERNRYYHDSVAAILRRFIPPGSRLLVVGSQTGDLLAALDADPSGSLGVDAVESWVRQARSKHPAYRFECRDLTDPAGTGGRRRRFDHIVMPDVIGRLRDLDRTFTSLHPHCGPTTRLTLTYYNGCGSSGVTAAARFTRPPACGREVPPPSR